MRICETLGKDFQGFVDFGKGFMALTRIQRLWERIHRYLQGFPRLWERISGIHETLKKDLWGFAMIHKTLGKDLQEIGKGFVRIHKTLGKN